MSTILFSVQKEKYRALYDFTATRDDELTLVAGSEVYVSCSFQRSHDYVVMCHFISLLLHFVYVIIK